MPKPKLAKSKEGEPMHYSVGALIEKDGKYLLIDRAIKPFGYAGPAGHIDEGETKKQALLREVKEETGLDVIKYELLFKEKLDWNWCSKNVEVHYWYLYKCDVEGDIKFNQQETKSIDWYTKEKIKDIMLEKVWDYWFRRLKII